MKNQFFLCSRLVIYSLLVITFTMVLSFATSCSPAEKNVIRTGYIDIDSRSPWYWNYNGKTVMLIGASWQDNLFNHPNGLKEHLDVLASVGGNYLRNTMSHRNIGNVFAYMKDENGIFDLDRFNEEYWQRFSDFLEMTYERDMIVQIEIWDPWDKYEDHQSFGGWSHHPYNPQNNINYSSDESGLPTVISYPPTGNPSPHPFFRTVPALDGNEMILEYQKKYIDKLISISLEFPNILYCIHNETGELVEFGDYWADYIHQQAREKGVPVHITDMRRSENIRSSDHAHIYENPGRYTFLDISQNNAWSGLGQQHYDNILEVRERTSFHPRPINNNKNYGAARHGEEESIARMGRIIFAGSASARFHRPHPFEDPAQMYEKSDFGLGLSPRAQQVIKSLRLAVNELDIALTSPRNDLLGDRSENEAYLLAEPGHQYAAYFPDGGSVTIDMSGANGQWHYKWVNMDEGEWSETGQIQAASDVTLTAPGTGHWIVVILPD
jgi:hypothetical protein